MIWGQFGVGSVSIQARFGVDLGLIRGRFGSDSGGFGVDSGWIRVDSERIRVVSEWIWVGLDSGRFAKLGGFGSIRLGFWMHGFGVDSG